MADETASGQSGNLDPTALNEIASNGQFANQAMGEVTKAIAGLTDIVLPASRGGTGISSYTIGDLLYADSTTSLAKLADVATGNALVSGGIGSAPSWGKVTPSHFSGVLPVANGGTNRNALTSRSVLIGAGTSSVNFASPGVAGQLLTSTGASSDPAFQVWVDGIGGLFSFPDNITYKIWLNSPFAGTITSTTTICSSGSCTATFKINGTTIGGTANSVTTSEQTQSHASSNVFAISDDLNITISSNSSCQYMSFMIAFTRP